MAEIPIGKWRAIGHEKRNAQRTGERDGATHARDAGCRNHAPVLRALRPFRKPPAQERQDPNETQADQYRGQGKDLVRYAKPSIARREIDARRESATAWVGETNAATANATDRGIVGMSQWSA